MSDKVLQIQVRWDEDGQTWWAESDDIPGLVAQADTVEELVGVVQGLAPDLLHLNGHRLRTGQDLWIRFTAERMIRLRMANES